MKTSVLGVSLVLLLSPSIASSQGQVTVAHTVLQSVASADLGARIESALSDIASRTFGQSTTKEPASLREFTETATLQATRERWRDISVQLWAGGIRATAGYFVKVSAIDASGDPVELGAFIAVDEPQVAAIMQDADGQFPSTMREVSY